MIDVFKDYEQHKKENKHKLSWLPGPVVVLNKRTGKYEYIKLTNGKHPFWVTWNKYETYFDPVYDDRVVFKGGFGHP